jgi:hypothetical protein
MGFKKFTLLLTAVFIFTSFLISCGKQSDKTIHWVEEDIAAVNGEEIENIENVEKIENNEAVSETVTPENSETGDGYSDDGGEEDEKAYPTLSPSATPDTAPKPSPPAKKSTAATKKSTANLPSLQVAGAKVYVTKSGKKFHRPDCSSLSKSKIETLYEDAVAKGYTACGSCKP